MRGGERSSLDYRWPRLAWWPTAAACHGVRPWGRGEEESRESDLRERGQRG